MSWANTTQDVVIVSTRDLDLCERGHMTERIYLGGYSMNSSTCAHESKPHMQKQITLEDSVHSCISLQMLSWSLGKTQLSAIRTTKKQSETFLYLGIWCNKKKLGNNLICDRIRNHALSVSLQFSTWPSLQHSVYEQSISNDILKFSTCMT